jgi:site-specific DNA-cytosine methylase
MIELGNIYDNGHNSVAGRVYSIRGKSSCLSALGGGGGAKTGLYLVDTPIIHQRKRGFNKGGQFTDKSPLLTTSSWEHNNHVEYKQRIRRLTEIEAERVQTIPDNYTEGISSTQRYKSLGNGWNVDTIVYLFSYFNGNSSPDFSTSPRKAW